MGQERVRGNGPEHVALNGQLARTEVFGLDGSEDDARPFHVEESDYELRLLPTAPGAARARAFVAVASHRSEDSDRTDDVRIEERRYDYDAAGNVVRERLLGHGTRDGVRQPRRGRVTEIEYARAAARQLVDRVARIVERDESGAILRERRRYYDGPDFAACRSARSTGDPHARGAAGPLRERLRGPLRGHDGRRAGLPRGCRRRRHAVAVRRRRALRVRLPRPEARTARPVGNEEGYEYDADGLFRVALRDSLGETRYVYDRAVGQPTSIVYPDGATAGFAYDAQGRVTASLLPGDDPDAPPRTFSYDDASVPGARRSAFRAERGSDEHRRGGDVLRRARQGVPAAHRGGRRSRGRLRPQAAQPVGRGPARVRADGGVLARLRAARRRGPRAAPGALRRARARRRQLGLQRRPLARRYRPFEVALFDAGRPDTPRREQLDVLGDRTAVVQELGDGAAATTGFAVGAAGDLLAVRDDSGDLLACTYDRRGGRLAIDHREGGRRRVFRNARGTVVRSIDAAGNDLRAEIDAQGRLGRLTLDGATVEELTYDDESRNAIGRLASVSYPGGRQDFTYDPAGRIVRHEYAFDGADRTESLTYEYDALGRELATTHTDGRRIARELTPNGWVRAIPGVIDDVVYDPRGLPIGIRYANGVVTELAYTRGPGRVRSQRTIGPAGQVLHDVGYDRDALGLLARSDDATPGGAGVREYAYDPLGQLTAVAELDGPTVAYGYDNNYNLAALGDTGAALHHDDAARPYRLTGTTAAGGAREEVSYDAAGNATGHGARRFGYDYKHALTRFEDGRGLIAEYRYDPQGVRVSKVVDDGAGRVARTFFVGAAAEVRDGTPTLYVHLGELRVAVIGQHALRAPGSARDDRVLHRRGRRQDRRDRPSPVRERGRERRGHRRADVRLAPVRRGVGAVLHAAPPL